MMNLWQNTYDWKATVTHECLAWCCVNLRSAVLFAVSQMTSQHILVLTNGTGAHAPRLDASNTALQHEAGLGDIWISDAMCSLFWLIFDACFCNHRKSKFMSALPIVQRCNVKNKGDSEYLHAGIAWLMDCLGNNANQSLPSGKAVANSLTLTPWRPLTGKVAELGKSERANHNHV